MNDFLTFFNQTIKNFRDTGSVAPSSKFLARKMVKSIDKSDGMVVVELGPGTGAFTSMLLSILPGDARLISVEINKDLVDKIASKFDDKRLRLVHGDAQDLRNILDELGLGCADYIVSGIPLGNLPKHIRRGIYSAIYSCLKPEGIYTQFQYFLANYLEIRRTFEVRNVAYELRNLPPAFVYTCGLRSKR